MFLSSKNLVRHFWMMWSTKSDSGIRFSDCRSFSKDFTWEMEITLTCESRKAFTELCETARDLSCKTARLFVALNIQNIWGVCVCLRPTEKAGSPSHSFLLCQTRGPGMWCLPACSAPPTSPGTENTKQKNTSTVWVRNSRQTEIQFLLLSQFRHETCWLLWDEF